MKEENAIITDEVIEIIVKTDLKKEVLQEVEWNYSDLEKQVKDYLTKYENLVVTEDDIKEAAKLVAKLNKFSKALNDEKIRINKILSVAPDKLSSQTKTLIGLITTVSTKLSGQVKEYEQLETEKKKTEIVKIYDEKIGDLKELFPIEKFWLDSWLLKGTKIEKIADDIGYKITEIRQNLDIISNAQLKYKKEAIYEYVRTMSVSQALQKNTQLIENDKRFEEIAENKRLEDEKLQEIRKAVIIEKTPIDLNPPVEPVKTFAEAVELKTKLVVTVPVDKLDELKDYLFLNGFDYEVVR